MAGFDAAVVVEPLDFKFDKFIPGCNGTITEPTDAQITKFVKALAAFTENVRDQLPDTGGDEEPTPGEVAMAIGGAIERQAEMAAIYAELCSGTPDAETLLKLPLRIRSVFYSWLQGEVMNPEVAPGGGSAQVTTLRSAAAG